MEAKSEGCQEHKRFIGVFSGRNRTLTNRKRREKKSTKDSKQFFTLSLSNLNEFIADFQFNLDYVPHFDLLGGSYLFSFCHTVYLMGFSKKRKGSRQEACSVIMSSTVFLR